MTKSSSLPLKRKRGHWRVDGEDEKLPSMVAGWRCVRVSRDACAASNTWRVTGTGTWGEATCSRTVDARAYMSNFSFHNAKNENDDSMKVTATISLHNCPESDTSWHCTHTRESLNLHVWGEGLYLQCSSYDGHGNWQFVCPLHQNHSYTIFLYMLKSKAGVTVFDGSRLFEQQCQFRPIEITQAWKFSVECKVGTVSFRV